MFIEWVGENRRKGFKKKFISILIVLIVFVSLITSSVSVNAGWVDDWFDDVVSDIQQQSNDQAPATIKGATRRYFTGGYSSIRWRTANLAPFSFSPPRITFGCGGVDIFLGSMGLLNFDYSVERLKTIMKVAGVFAFRYAIAKMSEKANQILDAIEATANFLNQLQLNECEAGKALAAVVMSPFSEEAAKDRGVYWQRIKSFFGQGSSWKEMIDKWKKTLPNGQGSGPGDNQTRNRSTSKCSSDMKTLVDGGFLGYLYSKGKIPLDFLSLARGLVGEVWFFDVAPRYIPGCLSETQKAGVDIVNVFLDSGGSSSGGIYTCQLQAGANVAKCVCNTKVNASYIKSKVESYLIKYYESLRVYQRPNRDTLAFIGSIVQFPVYELLRMGYQVGASDIDLFTNRSALVYCTSYFYAAGLLANIIKETQRYIEELESGFKAFCSQSDPTLCVYCSSSYLNALKDVLKTFKEKAIEVYRQIGFSFSTQKQIDNLKRCMDTQAVVKTIADLDRIQQTLNAVWR